MSEGMKRGKLGRPATEKSQLRDKKVQVSFTQDEYDELKRMQRILNKPTLSATVEFFMEEGMQKVREEFLSLGKER